MRLAAVFLALLLALPARAVDRQRIATVNIASTSLFTFLGCVVQGKLQKRVQTRRDAARCFAAGGAAGIGFYQAKRLVADGDITTGWLVANLATSVVENTAAGEHPFSRLGYTFGPFRLRFATPADRARESYVDLDLSLVETGFLARMLIDADGVDIRDGMLWWETDERLTEDGRAFNGYTWGLYPGVWTRARQSTRNHEAVHAIQALQLDSVDPPALTLGRNRQPFRIRYLRAGAVNLTDNLFWGQRAYDERWVEIEAYRLVDDRKPPQ
ncbi:MAG: hypothetical protein QOJ98_3077 [Acidobacteriota bacterium]|jgi:hypothetical protein|nr:hypothetical protein [Acidobacteriota bacterium]